jgi:hypothetical protein
MEGVYTRMRAGFVARLRRSGAEPTTDAEVQAAFLAWMQKEHQLAVEAVKSSSKTRWDSGEIFARICGNCGAMEDEHKSLGACAGCGQAHYCDAACQKAAWKVHKKACKEFQSKQKKK